MDFKIANTINKMRFIPRQAINLNVNPNSSDFAPQTQKVVKVQMVRAKHNLRKAFAQKPDEFTQAQIPEVETVPTRIRELSKLPKHKRIPKVAIPKKHKTQKVKVPFENETQEILTPLLTKEEQKWIDVALRNHDYSWDYKPLEEHYRPEIEKSILNYFSGILLTEKNYVKATEGKTKAYFDAIKAEENYIDKLNLKEIVPSKNKKSVIIDLNNRLLPF